MIKSLLCYKWQVIAFKRSFTSLSCQIYLKRDNFTIYGKNNVGQILGHEVGYFLWVKVEFELKYGI